MTGQKSSAAPVINGPSQEALRTVAWQLSESKPAEKFSPGENHAAVAIVNPRQGYAHWRILQAWVDQTAKAKGGAWHSCKLVLRVYDVSCIIFNGLNAHSMFDVPVAHLCGHTFFGLPRGGTSRIVEVGFRLTNNEFIPAARSTVLQFPPDGASGRNDNAALLVDDRLKPEAVANLWEQESILAERRRPKLKKNLRIAMFAFQAEACGYNGGTAKFVSELARNTQAAGHGVHVFLPGGSEFNKPREIDGVLYHPLELSVSASPIETALSYARAAELRLKQFPSFDLYHAHEWMTGVAPWLGTRPTILSLSSIESVRLNGAQPSDLSLEIQKTEREAAGAIDCILTPDWLREKAIKELGVSQQNVHAFAMEGRLPNEWESPLDIGRVKMDIGFGPLDRLLLFVGPLEHAAGVDLLIEALPVALQRVPSLRIAFVGAGPMHGHLQHRANELHAGHAVRLLGHMEGSMLTRVLRAAEAVVLPSRGRVAHDEGVVDLARRAGKAVVTTHSGPAHLVQHEKNGIVTYDNPGSMVWALDRVLGDPNHTQRLGSSARRAQDNTCSWSDVARRYLDLCAANFPELTESSPH